MPVTRLNHAVLYVRDETRSAEFYRDVLGFRVVSQFPGAVFLQAEASTNDHDLGIFSVGESVGPSGAGKTSVGLYHLAWEVDTLEELARIRQRLVEVGALVGASDHGTTKALYAHDPDGLEFEVSWLVPRALLDEATIKARATIRPLDLDAELARYGGTTRGGLGVSIPGVA